MLYIHMIEEAQQRAELADKERIEHDKRLAEEKTSVAKEVCDYFIFAVLSKIKTSFL
jgi:hypothetical protein